MLRAIAILQAIMLPQSSMATPVLLPVEKLFSITPFIPSPTTSSSSESCFLHFMALDFSPGKLVNFEEITSPFMSNSLIGSRTKDNKGRPNLWLLPPRKVTRYCGILVGKDRGARFDFTGLMKLIKQSENTKWYSISQHKPIYLILATVAALSWRNIVALRSNRIPYPMFVLKCGFEVGDQGTRLDKAGGWFLCQYCKQVRSPPYAEFTCGLLLPSSCYATMMETYRRMTGEGRNVIWNYRKDPLNTRLEGHSVQLHSSHILTPFSREQPSSLEYGLIQLIFQDLNCSQQTVGDFSMSPLVVESSLRTPGHDYPTQAGQLFLMGKSERYYFITGSQVYAKKGTGGAASSTFLMPFDSALWCCILATITVTSVLVRGGLLILKGEPGVDFLSFGRMLLSMSSTLLDQIYAPHRTTGRMRILRGGDSIRIVYGCWILIAIVISNAYKGALKTDMTIAPEYETSWKQIEDLQNFSAYFLILDKHSCEFVESVLNSRPFYFPRYALSAETLCKFGLMKTLKECVYLNELYLITGRAINSGPVFTNDDYGSSRDDGYYNNPKLPLYEEFANKTRMICLEALNASFLMDVAKKPIAFLTPTASFRYYRDYFVQEMKQRRGALKLAFKPDSENSFFRRAVGLYITYDLDGTHRWVPNRIKVILSSGIYWFLAKWEQNNLAKEEGTSLRVAATDATKERNMSSLSFRNSELYVIFAVLLTGGFVCFWSFIFEMCWRLDKTRTYIKKIR